MVLAAGASVAGRSGAPLLGAMGVGERHFLQFSIAQEATADHAALNFLDRACLSARGLLQFFEILQSNELLTGEPRPIVDHHPSADRRSGSSMCATMSNTRAVRTPRTGPGRPRCCT